MKRVTPKAKPIPRDYDIRFSKHAEMRSTGERAIPLDMARDTIRTGRALATEEIGRRCGDVFEFSKTHIIVEGRSRVSKRVVAVCEVLGNLCHVVTLFNE